MATTFEPGDVFVFGEESGIVTEPNNSITVKGGGRTPISVAIRGIPHGAKVVTNVAELPGRIDHYHVLLGAAMAARVLMKIEVDE